MMKDFSGLGFAKNLRSTDLAGHSYLERMEAVVQSRTGDEARFVVWIGQGKNGHIS